MSAIKKYRPKPLSVNAISVCARILKCAYIGIEPQLSPEDKLELIDLTKTFSLMEQKIANEAMATAYSTSTNREAGAMLSELGGTDNTDNTDNTSSGEEEAHAKFLNDPSSCSITEIGLARAYMYRHDLMTPEEEAEYEAKGGE